MPESTDTPAAESAPSLGSLAARKALRFELDPSDPNAVAKFKEKYPELADIADQAAAYQRWPESGEKAVADAADKILRAIESRRQSGHELSGTTLRAILRGVFAQWYASTEPGNH